MKTTAAFILFSLVFLDAPASQADTFGSGANQFEIEFVSIGDPGNPDDTTGNPNPAGKVEYTYRMGKFEISRDMITKANDEGGLGVTMDLGFVIGGPRDDMPATGVSWFEAAMFVNWLNTGQGHQAAYNFDADGNFQLWRSAEAWQTGGENLFRHKEAFYFLPSADEWYKAAYYDSGAGVYFDFPTGSDIAPAAIASGTAADTAVYNKRPLGLGPADVTLAGGLSPYGIMGQGGNALEWEETKFDLVNNSSSSARGVRGGNWLNSASGWLLSSTRIDVDPASKFTDLGFRVASIIDIAIPGDFNDDERVDASDFLNWQRDRSVGDLADWQSNYGNGLAMTGHAVPEPPSILLAFLTTVSGQCGRGRRRS